MIEIDDVGRIFSKLRVEAYGTAPADRRVFGSMLILPF